MNTMYLVQRDLDLLVSVTRLSEEELRRRLDDSSSGERGRLIAKLEEHHGELEDGTPSEVRLDAILSKLQQAC